MTISDEKLSAFLDRELPEQEMAQIREAIQQDTALAERLADLARADGAVRRYAAAIDSVPMPERVLQLLREGNTEQSANVVDFSRWQQARQRITRTFREHAALAASIALVAGFAGGHFMSDNNPGSPAMGLTASVRAALDSSASGTTVDLHDDATLLAHFSFRDNQARLCRQFSLRETQGASENLACRTDGNWELIATARFANLLDSTLDVLMQGAALSLAEEAELLGRE
jgi:hypothetical protein